MKERFALEPIYLLTAIVVLVHVSFGGSRILLSLYALSIGGTPFIIGLLAAIPSRHLYLVDVPTCDGDESCPGGFDCRRPEEGGLALCVPGSRSAGEPASFSNCFSALVNSQASLRSPLRQGHRRRLRSRTRLRAFSTLCLRPCGKR